MKISKKSQVILAILEKMGPSLPSTDLMKYLFLFSKKQIISTFDFIPYRFGCFSFEAYHEISKLQEQGLIISNASCVSIVPHLKLQDFNDLYDRQALWYLSHKFKNIQGRDLLRNIYLSYPYFAIKSTILTDILSDPKQQERVFSAIPRNDQEGFYSIGYEGLSIEKYLNLLIKKDIKILADVRKNPISRKYGFSRKTLSNAVENIGIRYISFSDLGIDTQERQYLNTQSDYDILFAKYEKEVLSRNASGLDSLYDLYKTEKRVAITCFEKNPLQCHRTRILRRLSETHGDLRGRIWLLNES